MRPAYWTHRIAEAHRLPKYPGLQDVERACRERGIAVVYSRTLIRGGLYAYDPVHDLAVILMRAGASAEDVAHELYHDCIRDGRREHCLHVRLAEEEGEANLFARLLCSGAWSSEPDEPPATEPEWEAGYYARGLRTLEERFGAVAPEEFLHLRPLTEGAADLALREAERAMRR